MPATRLGRWMGRGLLVAFAAWFVGAALWRLRPLSAEEAQMLGDWRMTPFTSDETNDVRFTADRRYVERPSDPARGSWPTYHGSWTVSENRLMLRPDVSPRSGLRERLGSAWDRLVHDRRADWYEIRPPDEGAMDRRVFFVDWGNRCDRHLFGERLETGAATSANVPLPR